MKAPYVEPRSEQHRSMGREALIEAFRKGDAEASYELARRAANKARRNGKEEE